MSDPANALPPWNSSRRWGVDLHTHTNVSDGDFSPEELLDKAIEAGLEAVAITDHDTVAGIAPAFAAKRDIEVIAGIEMTCDHSGKQCHIIGLCLDPDSVFLREPLRRMRERRRERAGEIARRLANLGIAIRIEDRRESDAVGRPHIAEAIVRAGAASSTDEAFRLFLAVGRPAYIPAPVVTPYEAFDMIMRSGGVPILAHPHSFENPSLIRVFASQGLLGIEGRYPGYTEKEMRRWERLARDIGILVTSGSDFHGSARPDRQLGAMRSDVAILEEIKRKRRVA